MAADNDAKTTWIALAVVAAVILVSLWVDGFFDHTENVDFGPDGPNIVTPIGPFEP